MAPSPSTPQKGLWGQLRGLLLVAALALLLRWAVLEPRWIPSGSMLPSLQLEDRILVWKLGQRLGQQPQRGAIVVFHAPPLLQARGYDPDAALIKRVVGLPGDQLAVHNGELIRNGAPAAEPWLTAAMAYELEPLQVPEKNLLVLGDNRNASLDSHLWGPLPEQELIGVAIWRYWPLHRFGPLL